MEATMGPCLSDMAKSRRTRTITLRATRSERTAGWNVRHGTSGSRKVPKYGERK